IMDIIAGPDPLDPTTLGAPPWNAKRARTAPKELKIGVPTRFYVDDLESDIAAALDATIATLRKLGAKISKVELPDQSVLSAAALFSLPPTITAGFRSCNDPARRLYGERDVDCPLPGHSLISGNRRSRVIAVEPPPHDSLRSSARSASGFDPTSRLSIAAWVR